MNSARLSLSTFAYSASFCGYRFFRSSACSMTQVWVSVTMSWMLRLGRQVAEVRGRRSEVGSAKRSVGGKDNWRGLAQGAA